VKSISFDLQFPKNVPYRMFERGVAFVVPTLQAYAIEFSQFLAPNQLHGGQKEFVEGKDYFLEDDRLIWKNFEEPLFEDSVYRLIVHYHGIRDYRLLFPHIEEPELRERLGKFYEEAEVAFENGAWLCYSLMCGAVYEGLLHAYFGKKASFFKMIKEVLTLGVIDEKAEGIMHQTRNLRNLVHGNNFTKPYVTRLQAMDMRAVMDKLIKRNWKQEANAPKEEQG